MVRRLVLAAVTLWTFHGLTLVMAAVGPEIELISRAADVARDKDVVWLSLVTAIVSVGFSAWLVKMMLGQQQQTVETIRSLRDEILRLPCVHLDVRRLGPPAPDSDPPRGSSRPNNDRDR